MQKLVTMYTAVFFCECILNEYILNISVDIYSMHMLNISMNECMLSLYVIMS